MPKRSAGLLMYRRREHEIEVFLVHPGGPYWAKKDQGSWSIPKGEYNDGENDIDAAKREFQEETGFPVEGELIELGSVRPPGRKKITAWAFEGDCDPKKLQSNTFTMEWPPGSGREMEFPEIDRGDWYSIERARCFLNEGQHPFLDRLVDQVTLR